MQSYGNSWKIDAFREAITSELMTSSLFWKLLLVRKRVQQKLFFAPNLCKRVVHKFKCYEKCPFSNCSGVQLLHTVEL